MEKIWLQSYQADVPAEINIDEFQSLGDLFEQVLQKYGDKPAYANMGRVLTYHEVDKYSRDFAAYLEHRLNLKKGDRVALMMPNILQYPIALYGLLRAGLTVVNVNPLYTPRELEQQMKDSGAVAIVVLANFARTVQDVLPNTDLKHVIVTELGDMLSFPKAFIVNTIVKHVKHLVPDWYIPNVHWFHDVLHDGARLEYTHVDVHHDDIAFLQYTGGTTGTPKGAVLLHRNMIANLQQASAWIRPIIRDGEEIIITALPMYHIFSLTANCLTFCKHGALNVLITNPRDIPAFCKELKKYPWTCITGVNTLFNALLNNEEFHHLDFSRLRLSLGGGMAVQMAVAERWRKTTGCVLLEAYGLTETCPAVCINPMNLREYNGTIGLPISSTEVEIRDDLGQAVAVGDVGELYVRGPQVMAGYWQKPGETAKVIGADGYLATGDVAKIDEHGYVHLVDRKKDLVLVSGFNVYPNEVEGVIAMLPEVAEVAVIGVPDDCTGEAVKAFIVKKDSGLTAETILEHCKKNLTRYKLPKHIEFRAELPKTNVGKVLRRALR